MPEYIEPVVEKLLAVLKARTKFGEYGTAFTGVMHADTACWVMPRATEFDEEAQHLVHQRHTLTVKIGMTGTDPDEVAAAAVRAVVDVEEALAASWPGDWTDTLVRGVVTRVFTRMHDYGPLFERGSVVGKFPELDIVVEVQEEP